MIAELAKAVAYAKVPRLTFAVLHPRQAAQLKKVPFDLRTAYAPRLTAIGAALIAFPLGVALGVSIARGSRASRHDGAWWEGASRSHRPAARRPRRVHRSRRRDVESEEAPTFV